uniref:Variant surface glycoprotein 1125.1542 n=1 Tax=Trypanosoma brucei TaxID=5691 RepID=A0A1J0R776_9TRYP|nr:variant surface glycoprotein 1125.1542 [Trypanosoma brucei]
MIQATATRLHCRTVLLVLLATSGQADKTDKAGKAVNGICKEARYVRLLTEKLQRRLSDALLNQEALTKAPTAYQLAAAAASDINKRTAFTALAIVADRGSAAAIAQIKATTPPYQQVINLLKQRASRLTTLARHSPPSAGLDISTTVFTQSASHNSARTCGGSVALGPDKALNCIFPAAQEDDIRLENVNLADIKALNMADETKLTKQTATITAYCLGTECSANTASTATKGFCSEEPRAIAGKSHIIGATLTITARKATVREVDIHEKNNAGPCKAMKLNEEWGSIMRTQ